MELEKYVITGSAGFAGTNFAELIEAINEEDAWEMGHQICADRCESYGVVVYPNDEDIAELEKYGTYYTFELDYGVEIYDPKKHDKILY